MKIVKLYFFIVFLFLIKLTIAQNPVIVTQTGKTITIDFTLPTYQIKDINLLETCNLNETYHYIEIDDIDGEIDDIGFPWLPVHSVNLSIPSDANNFVLTSSNITSQIENLTYEIIPDLDDEKNEDFTVFTKDQSYYNSNGALYAFDCKYSNPYIIMGAKGITIHICPFQYDPLANELTVITSGTFTFTYASSLNDEMANVSERKQVFLESFFDNFDLSQSKYLLQESTILGRYLIITPPVFEANLGDFVEHKINMGYFEIW